MRAASYVVVFIVVLCGSALLGLQQRAVATVHQVRVFLDGLQETPPVATPATGQADVTFNDVTGAMTVSNGVYSEMIGTATDAHVHGYAAAGSPAGVVFGLTITVGQSSGTFSGSGIIPSDRIDDVMANLTYINLHSTFRPGGEIRGQIVMPEPASGATALMAAGTLMLARRRRVR